MARALSFALATLLAAAPALAEPVTIETARGPVELDSRPERVVVFDIAALDTIDALGVSPVGVPDDLYLDYLGHLEGEAEPVGTLFEPDFEAVAALEPDLIVVGGRSSGQYDALAAIAPTIDMTIAGESVAEDALARLDAYGTLFGKEEQASELAADLQAAVDTAREAAADEGEALVVLTNGPKISAYGPGSRFGWVHDVLGVAPAAEGIDVASHGQAVSFEFIHQSDPDWLVVIDRAAAIGEEADSARQTLENALVAETTAWQEDQVVYLDPTRIYIASGGLRSLTGLLEQVTAAFAK